jgi:hypothetical protein
MAAGLCLLPACSSVRSPVSASQVRKLPAAACDPALGALKEALLREGYRIERLDPARGVLAASASVRQREAFVNVAKSANECEMRATFFERDPFDYRLERGREVADPALYLRLFGRLK